MIITNKERLRDFCQRCYGNTYESTIEQTVDDCINELGNNGPNHAPTLLSTKCLDDGGAIHRFEYESALEVSQLVSRTRRTETIDFSVIAEEEYDEDGSLIHGDFIEIIF